MPSTITPTTVLLALSLAAAAGAASAPSFAGCLAAGSTPAGAVNLMLPTSAVSCGSACWSNGEYENSYFDLSQSFPCHCSHDAVLPSSFIKSTPASYAETECTPSQITYYATESKSEISFARRQLKSRLESLSLEARKKKTDAQCPTPLLACKISDGSAYQCIDTQLELESCGGCINGDYNDNDSTDAVDCTSLPGTASGAVMCKKGKCKAYRCLDGYKLTNHTCVAK